MLKNVEDCCGWGGALLYLLPFVSQLTNRFKDFVAFLRTCGCGLQTGRVWDTRLHDRHSRPAEAKREGLRVARPLASGPS